MLRKLTESLMSFLFWPLKLFPKMDLGTMSVVITFLFIGWIIFLSAVFAGILGFIIANSSNS